MYSVDIDNRPNAFEHVFKIINKHKCSDWRMKIDTRYANSTEIYLVFDVHFEEITLSDVPMGDEMGLDDILEIIDEEGESEDEEDVIEITTETNQTEVNSTKEMENKTMKENTFAQTLTNEQVNKVATAINAVYIMMGVTNKTVTTVDNTSYTTINLYVDGSCVMTMMGNYEESEEKLFEKVMFGNRISVTNTVEKEPERPVSWDALVDFATWCKDKYIESDEDAVEEIRKEYGDNTSLMNFMEIPELKRKFKVVICNKKQKMKREKEVDFATMIIIPMDEDYDPENYINPSYDYSAFVDEDDNDVSNYERDDWEMLDYDMDYTTDDCDLTIDEIREKYDADDIYNFDKYEDD